MRRMRGVLVLLNVLTVVLMWVGTISSAYAGTLVVFGEDYKKTTAGPLTSTKTFNVSHPGAGYTLRVFNGGEHGLSTHISSAVVTLNGKQILGPSDFSANAGVLAREIRLEAKNTLVVELRGNVSSFLTIVIDDKDEDKYRDKHDDQNKHDDKDKGKDKDNGNGRGNAYGHGDDNPGRGHGDENPGRGEGNGRGNGGGANGNGNGNGPGGTNGKDTIPPTIQATTNPPPNSTGWNNSNVTVSFVCNDGQSGILSCSGPTTVSTNGANQTITGTAVDVAGNSATATVVINLDKTAPSITPTATPVANANGWNRTDVTVSFVCSDALSGMASCSAPTTLSTNGANQIVTGTVTDNAGNTATASVSVNLDKSLPGIVATLTPAANSNGWNKSDVTVSFTCTDALSGTASCPGPTIVSTNGANQSVSGTTTDKAGNTATATVTVNLDKSAPGIVATATPAKNANGWNNSDVTVSFTCTDALSGTVSCPGPTTVSANGANQSVSGTTTDNAGNTATASVTVNLDKASPTIAGTATPAANANGWNNSDVTVSFTCTDALSGMAICPGTTTLFINGANQFLTGTATDNAGNTATTSVTVNLDKAAPSITAIAAPAANANGWNNSDVTVSFTCSDAHSGMASCPSPTSVSTDGANQTVAGTATDNADNTATATATVNLDKSAPTIVATATPAANANGWNNTNVTVTFTCSDALSGVTSCSPPATVTTQGAPQSVTGTSTDKAGNTAANTVAINLDKTAPTLTLSSYPASVALPDVTLSGTAADALSGLARVMCNSIDAAVAGTSFNCTLTLSPGPNTIQVMAFDVAGNSMSTSATITYVPFVPPPPGPVSVTWMNVVGVTASGNSLTKSSNSATWNAGADSTQVLQDGYGFVEFTATETTTSRIAGLGSIDTNQDYSDVDFGILLRNDGTSAVYESGAYRGDFGLYSANDRFRVEVRYGVVRYLRNGVLFFTSPTAIHYSLRVDTAFLTPGATLTDVRVGNFVWTDGAGVRIWGESLIKTGSDGWNAGGISTNTIESGDGYLEFTASENNMTRVAGLANLVTGVAVSDIRFGIQLNNNGTFEVVENGASLGLFGTYSSGDRFRVELRSGVVRYYRNNLLFNTSSQVPSYPLRADSALYSLGATLVDVTLKPLNWSGSQDVYTDGALLIKKLLDGWVTSPSTGANIQSGDGYAEFTALETNKRRGLGLKSGGAASTQQQIDYLLVLNETGTVEVFENGVSRGLFGSYQNGDHFRVEVQSGVIRYRKNGVLLCSNVVSPSYPLHAEAAFYSQKATLADVDLGDLVWTNAINSRTAGHALVKTAPTTGWDAGAASTKTVTSGFVEFTASEATTARIAGLSNGDTNQDYTDIDFAILLRADTTVGIYEAGTFRGNFGNYVAGDRFRVEVQGGNVRYLKNGTLLYTSTIHPLSPLRVDTSLNVVNASLFNVVFH